VLSLLLVVGCPQPLPPVPRPYPAPSTSELMAHLEAQRRAVRSLRAEAKVDSNEEGGQRVKLTMGILVADGGRVRLEAEAPVGGSTVAVLTADGRDFALLDARNNRFLAGPARACNVARFIRLELAPSDVVAVLTGSAPIEGEPVKVFWDEKEGGREVLELRTRDGGKELLWLDGQNRKWDLLRAERYAPSGAVVWRVEHERWEDRGGGVRLPGRTHVEQPPVRSDARLRFRELEPNVEVKDEQFRLAPPNGIPVERVDC
jgi:hypothetical protein